MLDVEPLRSGTQDDALQYVDTLESFLGCLR
jgi:hypothetical protein